MTVGPQPEEQPPLGEPAPALSAGREGSWYRSPLFVAAVALLVGAVAGFVAARSLDDDSSQEASSEARPRQTTVVTTTTVAPVRPLPPDCEEALRSAESVVQLLEHGFQSLRQLQVERIEEVVADLGRLRGQVTASVVACQEQLRR